MSLLHSLNSPEGGTIGLGTELRLFLGVAWAVVSGLRLRPISS